jgi:hypothetical protein
MLNLTKGSKFFIYFISILALLLLESCHNNIPCAVYAESEICSEETISG